MPADNSFKMQAVLIVNNLGSLSVFRLSFFLRLAVRLLSYTFGFLHLSFLFSLLTSGLSRRCHLIQLKLQTRPKSTKLRMLADILSAIKETLEALRVICDQVVHAICVVLRELPVCLVHSSRGEHLTTISLTKPHGALDCLRDHRPWTALTSPTSLLLLRCNCFVVELLECRLEERSFQPGLEALDVFHTPVLGKLQERAESLRLLCIWIIPPLSLSPSHPYFRPLAPPYSSAGVGNDLQRSKCANFEESTLNLTWALPPISFSGSVWVKMGQSES